MQDEWAKWQLEQAWYDEWEENDDEHWEWDQGQPQRAFDRYAHLDGRVSMNNISSDKTEGKGTLIKRSGGDAAEGGKKKKTERESSKTPPSIEQNKEKKRRAQEEEEKEEVKKAKTREPEPNALVPQVLKHQTSMIASYVKEMTGFQFSFPLTSDDKDRMKRDLPLLEECRLNIYWKRPAVGVHSKSKKRDVAYFVIDGGDPDYLFRLAAAVKAASMFVTWNNLGDRKGFEHVNS